jgi:hypothetical protein
MTLEDDNGLGTDNDSEDFGSEIVQELIGFCLDKLNVRLAASKSGFKNINFSKS